MSVTPQAAASPAAAFSRSLSHSAQRFKREREWHLDAALYLSAAGFHGQAEKCLRCHDPKVVVAHRVCSENIEHHATPVLYPCHLPICPTCSRYRGKSLVRRYGETALNYAQHGRDDFSVRHIVLTTPHDLEDPERAKLYVDSWAAVSTTLNSVLLTRLQRQLAPAERHKGRVRLPAHQIGYIAAADWGENGKLHFHVLFYGPYIQQDLLHERWARFSPGAAEDVWLRRVEASPAAIDRAVAYVGTLGTVPPALTPQLLTLLAGRHRVRTKGVFHGIELPPRSSQRACPTCGAHLVTTDALCRSTHLDPVAATAFR